jgi:hypothetical protein
MSAGPAARFAGSGPQLDAGHGGLGHNGKVNVPYMWLEFGSVGIRLRGRRLVGGLVTPRDIRYPTSRSSSCSRLLPGRGSGASGSGRSDGRNMCTSSPGQLLCSSLWSNSAATVSGSTVSSLLTVFRTVAAPGSTGKARPFNRTLNEPPTAANRCQRQATATA